MRAFSLALMLTLASSAALASSQADERPRALDGGPSEGACIYPLDSDGSDVCRFMVHVESSESQKYDTLVLLRDAGGGVMRRVDTLDLRPWVKPDQHLVFGDCGLEGGVNPSLIGLVEGYDHEVVPLKLWSVDFANGKIIESSASGVMCIQGSGD